MKKDASTSYAGCITFTPDGKGLGLSVLILFRVGHPPLFIPWNAIEVKEEKKFLRSVTNFYVKTHEVPI